MDPKKKALLDRLLIVIGIVAIVGALFYTKGPGEQQLYAVLDESSVVQSRLDQGDTGAQALVYYQTLVKFYAANNVVVFHENALISYPQSMRVVLPEPKVLYSLASEKGIVITDDDITRAQEEIEAQKQRILEAVLLPNRQPNG